MKIETLLLLLFYNKTHLMYRCELMYVVVFQNLTLSKDAKAARNYRDELDAIREKVRLFEVILFKI